MPEYTYKCTSCESQFDVTLSISALIGSQVTCPFCRSMKTRKVITIPNVIFKSKGFYKTDNRNQNISEE
jgi:putative FmdB family regulatory protein